MAVELYCVKKGSPQALPLVFIHGLFGQQRNLNSIASAFTNSHYVLQPDMRNHGQSPHHPQFNYQVMSDDLSLLLEQNSIHDAILIGHSMGGKVAMLHALKSPGTVRGIVVLDIAPKHYAFDYTSVIDNLLSIDLHRINSRKEADEQLSEHYPTAAFRQFLLQNLQRDDQRFYWRLALETIRDNIKTISDFPDERYPAFNKTTLFLAGENSDYVQAGDYPTIHSYFPNARIEQLLQAGHWLHSEQPELVIEKLRGFISSIECH